MSAEVSGTVKAMAIAQPTVFGPSGAYAQAYALYNMSYAGAMIVGPVWAGFIKESQGWGTMCWSLGILSAVSAVPTVGSCQDFSPSARLSEFFAHFDFLIIGSFHGRLYSGKEASY